MMLIDIKSWKELWAIRKIWKGSSSMDTTAKLSSQTEKHIPKKKST
jgi:hypothetical protein